MSSSSTTVVVTKGQSPPRGMRATTQATKPANPP